MREEVTGARWVDARGFDKGWSKLEPSGSGGQGCGYKVQSKEDGAIRFLKVLKAQKDRERRARMFREAAALSTFDSPSIPAFVETNAHRYADNNCKLYLVTEFIAGPTLAERVTAPLPLADAIEITDKLAATVKYLQDRDAVHRDIKPENIILRDGTLEPVLVDFGMTFNAEEASHTTGDWQELGNRFLRLPELSAYSKNKRDFRTDIAFLTGILFFCATGRVPSVLQDHERRLPHQVPGVDIPSAKLAAFFDRGFQMGLADRFSTIEEFRSRLATILLPPEDRDPKPIAREFRQRYSPETIVRHRQRAVTLDGGWKIVIQALDEASEMTDGVYVKTFSGDYDPNTDAPYRNMGLHHLYRQHLMRYWLKVTCRFVGSEFLISARDELGGAEDILLRTEAESPNFEGFERDLFITRLLNGAYSLAQV